MERNSILYKIRRKMQVCASYVLPPKLISKIYSYAILKKSVNLSKPKTFNEKIQWLKLYHYPKHEIYSRCADKYLVREFVINKGYENKLNKLLGVWEDAKDINFNELPSKFVLKCTHGCAYNIVCNDKSKLNQKEVKEQLNKWLKEDFGRYNIERHYSNIKKRSIICEEFLGDNITDYKFFCFNGEPKYIYVSNDLIHDRQAEIGFFYLDGKKMPLKRTDYTDIPSIVLPPFFDEMLEMAKSLCPDFPFVRVDFFLANDNYYFAELTFTPSGGMMPFNPDEYDLKWGELLNISNL